MDGLYNLQALQVRRKRTDQWTTEQIVALFLWLPDLVELLLPNFHNR